MLVWIWVFFEMSALSRVIQIMHVHLYIKGCKSRGDARRLQKKQRLTSNLIVVTELFVLGFFFNSFCHNKTSQNV